MCGAQLPCTICISITACKRQPGFDGCAVCSQHWACVHCKLRFSVKLSNQVACCAYLAQRSSGSLAGGPPTAGTPAWTQTQGSDSTCPAGQTATATPRVIRRTFLLDNIVCLLACCWPTCWLPATKPMGCSCLCQSQHAGHAQSEILLCLAAAAAGAGAVTHIDCLLPESDQCWAHLLGWVALAAKVPDPVERLIQVLLITIPVLRYAGTSQQWHLYLAQQCGQALASQLC